ncbi:hypothetical protein RJT34_09138 [Clitoria ternatea]|uniref:Cation/H+ exchanger domain-containing protein n=1 Tax=Clitoria ternatea TaxID=43366 RepID=A0AAN9K7F3_CLITE
MDSVNSTKSSLVCHDPHSYGHFDVWHHRHRNLMQSPTSLFFMQVSLITIVSQLVDACLKPMGQSSLVSQIIGGLLVGPSMMGHQKLLAKFFFPQKGVLVLDTLAYFSLVFFFFLWSLKMDVPTLLKTEKRPIIIGLSIFVFTSSIPIGLAFTFKRFLSMDRSLSRSLPFIALSQSLTVFISIAVLLTDMKLLNSDIGRTTISAAMSADIIGFGLTVFMFVALQSNGNPLIMVFSILSIIALFIVIIFVMRPIILWTVKSSGGESVNELCLICVILSVLLSALLSELVGQHFVMGPIILGLAVPEGPPLGTTLVGKMETVCLAFLYPVYLAITGLNTDIFKIDMKSLWIVTVIVVLSFFIKIGAVMLPGYFYKISMKECLVIGFIINGRGVAELSLYTIWLRSKLMSQQEFSLMVISILLINIILAPLIRCFYDPSKQYQTGRRCTIQQTRRDSELRVMFCIHNIENMPTILNLLEASYASRESMVAVIALVLVELIGRARPILVAHQPHDKLHSMACDSNHIDNALRQYSQQNHGYASVQSFTSVSTFNTMHDDICRIALDGRANILILPFHKRWEIDGRIDATNRSTHTMNIKVLERAPCSVGILVDRGILRGSSSLLTARSIFYVSVLFIGGADDVEALAYSSRMARHEFVNVTVVRFLQFGEENSKDRKHDSDLIDEYRYYNAGNRRFEIMDEVVKDGIEMSTCIKRLIDYFDLVMVGKEHTECAMLQGHDQWSECPELGVIGDMLASQDFVTKASVLVVQQQRLRGRFLKHTFNSGPNQRDQLVHDVPMDEISSSQCTISMDKF